MGTQVTAQMGFQPRHDFLKVSVSLIPLLFQAWGERDQKEEVLATFRRHRQVGARGGTDVKQGVDGPRMAVVDGGGVGAKWGVEKQVVVLEFGHLRVQPHIVEQGAG